MQSATHNKPRQILLGSSVACFSAFLIPRERIGEHKDVCVIGRG